MDNFLTKLYEEEQTKIASAEVGSFMKSLDRDDLEELLGLNKQAVAGPAEPEMPEDWQGSELDASQKAKDNYLAQEHQGTPKAVEKTDKWAQTCNAQEGTSKVKADKEDEPKTKSAEAQFYWADRIGRLFAGQASAGLEKRAKIFGAGLPVDAIVEAGTPYDIRQRVLESYLKEKSQEKPTGWGKALGGGALIGGGMGGLMGVPAGPGGALAGATIGALGGTAIGGLMRQADKEEIERSKRELAAGQLADILASRVGDVRQRMRIDDESQRIGEEFGRERRHREHMDTLRGRGSVKKASSCKASGMEKEDEFTNPAAKAKAKAFAATMKASKGKPLAARKAALQKTEAAIEKKSSIRALREGVRGAAPMLVPGAVGTALGAGTGALTAGEGARLSGALRGAGYGALGSVVGGGTGAALAARPGAHPLLPYVGGAMGAPVGGVMGGVLGGRSARKAKKRKEEGKEKESMGDMGDMGGMETTASVKAKIASRAMKVADGAPEHVKAAAMFLAGREMSKVAVGDTPAGQEALLKVLNRARGKMDMGAARRAVSRMTPETKSRAAKGVKRTVDATGKALKLLKKLR